MQVFVVGGAVRDALMGQRVNDRDWVVVGSTPEAMTAQGFAPVVMRLKTYALPVPADVAAYMDRVCALPGVKAWIDDALAEKDFIDFEEPFRVSR